VLDDHSSKYPPSLSSKQNASHFASAHLWYVQDLGFLNLRIFIVCSKKIRDSIRHVAKHLSSASLICASVAYACNCPSLESSSLAFWVQKNQHQVNQSQGMSVCPKEGALLKSHSLTLLTIINHY